jgi:hypothetical protein
VLATSGRGGEEVAPEERVGDELAEERGGVRDDGRVRRHRCCHVCAG